MRYQTSQAPPGYLLDGDAKVIEVPVHRPAPKHSPDTVTIVSSIDRYAYWSPLLQTWITVISTSEEG